MKLGSVADYPLESQSMPLKTGLMHRLEIWNNHICDRVGHVRMLEFRTVDASKMLKAIAEDSDLSKTTLQHIKSALERCFHSCEEGAFDGMNPVQDARIPRSACEPGETYA